MTNLLNWSYWLCSSPGHHMLLYEELNSLQCTHSPPSFDFFSRSHHRAPRPHNLCSELWKSETGGAGQDLNLGNPAWNRILLIFFVCFVRPRVRATDLDQLRGRVLSSKRKRNLLPISRVDESLGGCRAFSYWWSHVHCARIVQVFLEDMYR